MISFLGKIVILIILVCYLMITGCHHRVNTEAINITKEEVGLENISTCNAGYLINNSITELSMNIYPSSYFFCTHEIFDLYPGKAIEDSIKNILNEIFMKTIDLRPEIGQHTYVDYKFIFNLGNFYPYIKFHNAVYVLNAFSSVDLSLNVIVIDVKNNLESRITISGKGSAEGVCMSCFDAPPVIATATEEAIKKTLKDFIHKMNKSVCLSGSPRIKP